MKKIVSLMVMAALILTQGSFRGWAQDQSVKKTETEAAKPAIAPSAAQSSAVSQSGPPASDNINRVPVEDIFNNKNYQVESVADSLEYDKVRNLLIARGNVVLTHEDVKITADYAELDTQTSKATARGHVVIFKKDEPTIKGSEVYYDFKNHHGNFPDGRFVSLPWRGTGAEVEQKKEGLHTIKNCSVTTCGSENPNYEFRAKQATIYAGDKIVVRNVWLYVMGKKVFWIPYMVIPLNVPSVPFSVTAGNNRRFGYYVGISKGYYINKHLSGQLYGDWRERKGFGAGLRQQYNFDKWAKGDVKLYWTQDKEAPTPGHLDLSGRENPYELKQDRARGRISWRHRTDFAPGTHLILRYHRVADEYFLQDFFHREHRTEIQPSSFVTLTHNTEKYGVLVHTEKKMNSYEKTIEHLPQIRADLKNQPVLIKNLYNESQTSFDNMSKQFGRAGLNADVVRGDAVTHFYYPVNWNEIKIMPFTGLRSTYYSRDKMGDNDHLRVVANQGIDLREQFYKTMATNTNKWGVEINQLRHVFEPNFQIEASETNLAPAKINQFDSIDQFGNTMRLQFGMDNRLQTKRVVNGTMQRVDIVSMNTFVRYDYQPLDRRGSAFTTLGNELTLRPYNWLLYEAKLEHDVERKQIGKFSQDLIFQRDRWRLLFGHRYVHPDQLEREGALEDIFGNQPTAGNQFVFEGRYTINSRWDVAGYTRWNATHRNFEEWQVSATRNLGCDLFLDFGFDMRQSLVESSNRELFFNLRMQSYPGIHLSTGTNQATISDPRIGQTVDGSNEQQGYFSSSYGARYSPDAYLY